MGSGKLMRFVRSVGILLAAALTCLACTNSSEDESSGTGHEVGLRPNHIPDSTRHVDLVHASPDGEDLAIATESLSTSLADAIASENDWLQLRPRVHVAEVMVVDDSFDDQAQICVVLVNLSGATEIDYYSSTGCLSSGTERPVVVQDEDALVVGNVVDAGFTHAVTQDMAFYQERHETMFAFPIDGNQSSIAMMYADGSNRTNVP